MAIKFETFRGTAGGVTGGLVYKGSYNATTSTPSLVTAEKGDFYIVSVAGSLASVTLNVGDHIVFNQDAANPVTSAMFDVIDNTDAVQSVNTQTGVVVLDTDDIAETATNQYFTSARFDTQLATKSTSDVSEGTNLYYTDARFDTRLGTKSTSDVSEGTNLYYTNARADARIGAADLTDLNDVDYTAGSGINDYVLTYVHANTRWEAKVSASAPVTSVNTQTGAVVLDTDDVAEGTNQYFTSARFDTQLATKSTSDLSEGTNLYYTNARFDTQLATKSTSDVSEGTNLYYTDARFDTRLGTKSTSDVSEGTNLYYTNARADARIGAANLTDLNDVDYTAGAGINDYVLTYVHANTRWEAKEATGSGSNPTVTSASPSSAYTISTHAGIEEIYILTPSADISVNLPSASSCGSGYKYQIKNMASANTLTIDPDSGAGETIDTASTFVLNVQYQSITIITDGSNWFII